MEQQGIKYRARDLVNRINFYVQIKISAEENTPASQTLYLTLVLTEPEHAWKIDTFATELVPAPDYAGSVPYAALFSGADRGYYDALVAIGRYYTFLNHGFYERAYRLRIPSSAHLESLEKYVDEIQSFGMTGERAVKITPYYPPQWRLPCLTPDPANGRTFYAYIFEGGEMGAITNRIHSYFINMVLENDEWKIYSVNSGQ
jgi:hypothetical protein